MELSLNYKAKFNKQAGQPRSEREELVGKFLAELNLRRVSANFPAYSYSRLARMLQGVPTSDLYPFFKKCEQARDFSRFFHWSLKPNSMTIEPHLETL